MPKTATSQQLNQNLRLCTWDGLTATPIVYLLQPGNFVIAALLTGLYQLPPATYGLIVSLPYWGNFAQAFLMPFMDRIFAAKTVTLIFCTLQILCWAAMAVALPYLPVDAPELSGAWFLFFFTISAAVTAFTGVSWTSWIQEWVPRHLRAKYFGARNRLMQIAQVIFLVLVGELINRNAGSVRAFQFLLGATVALRIVSVILQHRMRTHSETVRTEAHAPYRQQLGVLLGSPAFLWLIAYGAAWGFAVNCFGPFYAVFMYDELSWTVRDVSQLVILTSVGGALSYPFWGAMAGRFGNKPVMLFCMIAWQLQNFAWCFLTPDNDWMLYVMWSFGGMVAAGFTLGLFNIQLRVIPPAAKTLAISVNLACTSLVTAIAPVIGGGVLGHFLNPGEGLRVYHTVFIVQPVLALLACLLLVRVHEPAASPLSSVVGAMRNIRTLSGMFGLGFLANFIFVKNPRR